MRALVLIMTPLKRQCVGEAYGTWGQNMVRGDTNMVRGDKIWYVGTQIWYVGTQIWYVGTRTMAVGRQRFTASLGHVLFLFVG
jgi:hypothetical protein